MSDGGKRYYWLKLNKDFFSSKRVKKLRRFDGGDTLAIIYLKMQLLSLDKGGCLTYTGLEETFAEELALDLDEDPEQVKKLIDYLLSCNLLVTEDETDYYMPFVVENTGSENASAMRVREYRSKQKALQCNTNVTPMKQKCNANETQVKQIGNVEKEIDIEIDIEKEIDKKKKKEKASLSSDQIEGLILEADLSSPVTDKIRDWMQYKAARKELYKEMGFKSLLSQVKKHEMAAGAEAVCDVIDLSMSNEWKGIIWDKLSTRQTQKDSPIDWRNV